MTRRLPGICLAGYGLCAALLFGCGGEDAPTAPPGNGSPAANPVPAPTAPAASPGSQPGTIELQWFRPPYQELEVPLAAYEIAFALHGFAPGEFDSVEVLQVLDGPTGVRQVHEVGGFQEGLQHHLRVRVVDELGRRSDPTELVESRATGRVNVTGQVVQLLAGGLSEGVSDVPVRIAGKDALTGPDGFFEFPAVPDSRPFNLRAAPAPDLGVWGLVGSAMDPVDRELRVVLLPRLSLRYVKPGGVEIELPLLEHLLELVDKEPGAPPFKFHPWPRYPVPVYVWEYTGTAHDAPAYHEAIALAIDRWNDGATGDDRLLEYVAVADSLHDPRTLPDPYGVMVRLYPNGSVNLGEADFLVPAHGLIAHDVPRVMRVRLRRHLPRALLERIAAHELGHVLGLVHPRSLDALMHGTSNASGGIPTAAELYTVQFLRHGGHDMDASWFREAAP